MKLNSEIAIETAEVELLLTEGSVDEALDKFKDMVHATKGQMSDKFKEFKTILRKYMSMPPELKKAPKQNISVVNPTFLKNFKYTYDPNIKYIYEAINDFMKEVIDDHIFLVIDHHMGGLLYASRHRIKINDTPAKVWGDTVKLLNDMGKRLYDMGRVLDKLGEVLLHLEKEPRNKDNDERLSILRRLFRIEGKMVYTISFIIELCESVFKSMIRSNTK